MTNATTNSKSRNSSSAIICGLSTAQFFALLILGTKSLTKASVHVDLRTAKALCSKGLLKIGKQKAIPFILTPLGKSVVKYYLRQEAEIAPANFDDFFSA